MTLEEFKQELVKLGYKVTNDSQICGVTHTECHKRNKKITIQDLTEYQNLYYEKNTANGDYEYNQHRVTDFKKALANILKFERKIK